VRPLLRISAILSAMLALGAICSTQTDPKNVPQPPTAELRKFDPFLGKYQVSGDFANLPWTGTLELKKVIKGWYIEQTILVKTEGIDREFRILATWDKNVQKYRLWGFQTLSIMADNGGEIRFEGDEMITEWVSVRPDGSQVASSNRYRFVSKDELEILSYRQAGSGPLEKIGFLKGKRVLTAEEASSVAEAELRAVIDERRKASVGGNTEMIAKSMADEYIQTDIAGYVQNKTTWLNEYFKPLAELIVAGKFHWEAFDEKDIQIRMYGDTAVVIGTLELKGSGARPTPQHTWVADPDAHPSLKLRFTRVYVKRDGQWLLAALHNTVPAQQSTK
jgi:uncharacterized protein (TIGR02246 family)